MSNPMPYAPCMEYLPTFATIIAQIWVNIPYMEHMGMTNGFIHFLVPFAVPPAAARSAESGAARGRRWGDAPATNKPGWIPPLKQ